MLLGSGAEQVIRMAPVPVLVIRSEEAVAKPSSAIGNPGEARASFLKAATETGFPSRSGHSAGYCAWIGQQLQPQFPDTPACLLRSPS